MFKTLNHSGKDIGHIFKGKDYVVFFGNCNSNLEILQSTFPDWEFLGLKQVHSSIWTKAQKLPTEADAHFTSKVKKALYIKTADCIPIVLAMPDFIAAIHAGWKGISKGILTTGPINFNGANAYIGPHISCYSFEVGHEVIKKLMKAPVLSEYPRTEFCVDHPNSNKSYVHLAKMAQYQLQKFGVIKIEQFDKNTFNNLDYYSYRRDGSSSRRQISFIVRI